MLPLILSTIAGMAPSIIDQMMTANANAHKQEGEDPEEGHPLMAAALGTGLGLLTHRGLSAFPKMRAKGEPPPVNDPAKATPKASKPVAAIDDEAAEGGMSTAAEEAAESAGNVTFGPSRISSPFPTARLGYSPSPMPMGDGETAALSGMSRAGAAPIATRREPALIGMGEDTSNRLASESAARQAAWDEADRVAAITKRRQMAEMHGEGGMLPEKQRALLDRLAQQYR